MSMNLLDSVKNLLTGEMINQASSSFGETPAGISKALTGLVPVLLSGVVNKASSDNGSSIMDFARQAEGSGILDNPGGLFSGGSGTNNILNLGTSIISGLFGNKANGLINTLSGFAGIKSSSTSSLLSALAPMALGLIGKYVSGNGLSANGLVAWLSGQKDSITKAIPTGLNVSGILGDYVPERKKRINKPVAAAPAGMPNWLLPLLLVLLGALFLWYFLKGSGDSRETIVPVQTEVKPMEPAAPVVESYKVKLVDGTELDALKGGIEDKLVACITDASCVPGKDLWFDFDNLNFEMGSAKITAESQVQVNNIASILKAYPSLKLKIGGYTDKTGDENANKKLSQERAEATLAAIVAAGGNSAQLEGAEGYGSAFATVPAEATDEQRKVDRRISVSVRAK